MAIGDNLPSATVSRLLFDYEFLSSDEIEEMCKSLPRKLIRWIGMNHPDNWTRKIFYELTGVPIGEGTVLNFGLTLYDAYEGLAVFGKRVAVAHDVTVICDSNPNNSLLHELPYVRDHLCQKAASYIDDDAWLGTGSIVLPGIRVGAGAIVGAGAVVHEDVEPYTVVAGVPAKYVRSLRSKESN